MIDMKKIEIIADSIEIKEIVRVIEEVGIEGYTILPVVSGKGRRGIKNDEGLTGVLSNSHLMILCQAEKSKTIVEKVRPLLKNVGGICIVSDTKKVVH